MSKKQRIIYYVMGVLLGIIIVLAFLKYSSLYWVESNTNSTKVSINFLLPMQMNGFEEHLHVINNENQTNTYDYSVNWINQHSVELMFKEHGAIKGQKAILKVDHAPTAYKGLTQSVTIPIQFKADIELISSNQFLTSSTHPFLVAFNTPISLQQLSNSIQSEVRFNIQPCKNTNNTQFIFSPAEVLKNGETYVLLFKAGMRAKSGTLLKEDQVIILTIDEKPTITKTYPINGDRWIGLYPRILLESKEEIIKAQVYINDTIIEGNLVDSKHAYFLLDKLLKPETTYHLAFQVQAPSGELSEVKQVDFTTTTLNQKRFWLDIQMNSSKEIKCYEGTKCVRVIPFEMSKKIDSLLFGTYYLQSKFEVYEDAENHLGGNYWMNISSQLGIQGALRNSYWELVDDYTNAKNIIISDDDAAWLYEQIQPNTMIIVRN